MLRHPSPQPRPRQKVDADAEALEQQVLDRPEASLAAALHVLDPSGACQRDSASCSTCARSDRN